MVNRISIDSKLSHCVSYFDVWNLRTFNSYMHLKSLKTIYNQSRRVFSHLIFISLDTKMNIFEAALQKKSTIFIACSL